jgi:hypothetical protein
MTRDEIAVRFQDQDTWILPDPALRERVLAAAGPRVCASAAWPDRIWFSRRWRVAALAFFIGGIGLDWLAGGPTGSPASVTQAKPAAADAGSLGRLTGLPPELAAELARRQDPRAEGTRRQDVWKPGVRVDGILEGDW